MNEHDFIDIVGKLRDETSFNISVKTKDGLNLSASKSEEDKDQSIGFKANGD